MRKGVKEGGSRSGRKIYRIDGIIVLMCTDNRPDRGI